MKSVIVGTAGHIDHGKTALVKALTGIDADRLEEEKRRGITIDLGFAHLELRGPHGDQLRFGFIDVPGHERFVRNMLAGVGGIDLVLLVIAADEGIRPQTREHFDICRLLSVEHGITVLTKSDLVDPETLEVLQLEIQEFLGGSFLEKSPVIPVSSLNGAGLDVLKSELARVALQVSARDSAAITRLPIDRVFTMKGFGTVVTGTLIAGTIGKEDELELFPQKSRVRVRGVQVHGSVADRAVAGERTALNLAGIDKNELERGMVLASPGLLETATRIAVRLSLLPSTKPLKNNGRVHLHAFASEVVATTTLLVQKELPPGAEGFALLRLSPPLLLFPGDRFIIRQFSPVITIGGGVVLDNAPPSRIRDLAGYRDLLNGLTDLSRDSVLRMQVTARGVRGLKVSEAAARTGLAGSEIQSISAKMPEITNVRGVLIQNSFLNQVRECLLQTIADFHRENSLATGIPKENLRERLVSVNPEVFAAVLDAEVNRGQLVIGGDLVHLPGRGAVMTNDEAQSRTTIEQAFASAGLKVPALKDVLSGLKIERARAQQIVTLLLRERVLVKVSDDLVFHHSALSSLRKSLAERKARAQKIDVPQFKELTGVSRKYAIPLLEYLDRERVTRRVGDERIIL